MTKKELQPAPQPEEEELVEEQDEIEDCPHQSTCYEFACMGICLMPKHGEIQR